MTKRTMTGRIPAARGIVNERLARDWPPNGLPITAPDGTRIGSVTELRILGGDVEFVGEVEVDLPWLLDLGDPLGFSLEANRPEGRP